MLRCSSSEHVVALQKNNRPCSRHGHHSEQLISRAEGSSGEEHSDVSHFGTRNPHQSSHDRIPDTLGFQFCLRLVFLQLSACK